MYPRAHKKPIETRKSTFNQRSKNILHCTKLSDFRLVKSRFDLDYESRPRGQGGRLGRQEQAGAFIRHRLRRARHPEVEPSERVAGRDSGVPAERPAIVGVGAFDERAALNPLGESVVSAPRDRLYPLDERAAARGKLAKRRLGPPCEMMGRGADQEIRDARKGGWSVGNADADEPAGFRSLDHVRKHGFGSRRCSRTWKQHAGS